MTKISFRRRIACSCNRSCATVTFSKLCLATRIVTSIRRWSQPITVNDVTRITGVYVGWDKVSRHSVNPHLSPKVRMRWSRRPHAAEVSRPRSENVPAQRWHDKESEMPWQCRRKVNFSDRRLQASPMPFLEGRYLYILSGANCESFSPAGEPVASCARLARIRSLPGDRRPSRSRSVVP